MTGLTPAEAIAATLDEAGVRHLFGVPGGGGNLDVIGACEAAGIRFVLAHSETAAAIMATAWGEVSGSIGACLVTRGPGAASTVNGAAQAEQDRQPLLVICDAVDEASATRIAHQKIDQHAMFAPVTSWSAVLGSVDPVRVMRDAIAVATSPPRGAVHLDVDPSSTRVPSPPPVRPPATDDGSISDIAGLVARSRRLLVVAGVGARPYARTIRDLVAGTGIPVLATYKATGVVPASGPNAAGSFTNADTDRLLIDQADLVLTIGLDSIELIPNPWSRAVPVVSLAESRDGYAYVEPVATSIGPIPELVAALPALTDEWPSAPGADHRSRLERALLGAPAPAVGVAPARVVRLVRAKAPAGSIATVDAGAHMLVVMPLWPTEQPGELLISSGLATMGYSLPAAIGAALARPDVRVFCFVGDGGLQMCSGELETLARLDLPVTVVVFNDSALSLIRVKQRSHGHGGAGAVAYTRTDFAALAGAMGVPGRRAADERELEAALTERVAGPLLIDVTVDPDTYRRVIEVTRNAHLG